MQRSARVSHWSASESGQSNLEWLLTVPVCLYVFACTVQYLWIVQAQLDLEDAAQAAGRAVIGHPDNLCFAWFRVALTMAPNTPFLSDHPFKGQTRLDDLDLGAFPTIEAAAKLHPSLPVASLVERLAGTHLYASLHVHASTGSEPVRFAFPPQNRSYQTLRLNQHISSDGKGCRIKVPYPGLYQVQVEYDLALRLPFVAHLFSNPARIVRPFKQPVRTLRTTVSVYVPQI